MYIYAVTQIHNFRIKKYSESAIIIVLMYIQSNLVNMKLLNMKYLLT